MFLFFATVIGILATPLYSTTDESDFHFNRFQISFSFILLIRAFNSAGKHMASFCYFTEESGSTKTI